ncbi:MAG: hypothetical protein ACOCVX_01500 [Bacteroidales bacterium]
MGIDGRPARWLKQKTFIRSSLQKAGILHSRTLCVLPARQSDRMETPVRTDSKHQRAAVEIEAVCRYYAIKT